MAEGTCFRSLRLFCFSHTSFLGCDSAGDHWLQTVRATEELKWAFERASPPRSQACCRMASGIQSPRFTRQSRPQLRREGPWTLAFGWDRCGGRESVKDSAVSTTQLANIGSPQKRAQPMLRSGRLSNPGRRPPEMSVHNDVKPIRNPPRTVPILRRPLSKAGTVPLCLAVSDRLLENSNSPKDTVWAF
jgi:hypothetical protein